MTSISRTSGLHASCHTGRFSPRKYSARRPVSSVSFADGPGFRIKRLTYGPAAEKAAHFSRAAADAIAQQICTKYREVRVVGALENVRVEPNADQRAAIEFNRRAAQDFNRLLLDALTMAPGLAKLAGR